MSRLRRRMRWMRVPTHRSRVRKPNHYVVDSFILGRKEIKEMNYVGKYINDVVFAVDGWALEIALKHSSAIFILLLSSTPKRQRRVEPVPQRTQNRPRYND